MYDSKSDLMSSNSNSKRMRSIPIAEEDRISNLPDEVICHILSFLPTKLAASTTILSKRWKPLWLSVLSLDFDDKTFKHTLVDIILFSRYVNSAILSQPVTTPILSLISMFLNEVLKISILIILLFFSRINLPSCVLCCKTLVVFKLKKVIVFDVSQVDFPRLKTLCLNRVCFQRYQDVTKFLYACPILEDLQTKVLSVIDSNGLVPMEKFQALPTLIKAKIYDTYIPIDLVREAKFLQAILTIGCYPLVQFPMFHNLTHLDLFCNYTTCYSYEDGKWNWLIQMLKHCPKLQNLVIHEGFADGNQISNKSWKDPHVPECLSSELRKCSLRSCKCMDFVQQQFAEYVVQNSCHDPPLGHDRRTS